MTLEEAIICHDFNIPVTVPKEYWGIEYMKGQKYKVSNITRFRQCAFPKEGIQYAITVSQNGRSTNSINIKRAEVVKEYSNFVNEKVKQMRVDTLSKLIALLLSNGWDLKKIIDFIDSNATERK